MRRFHAMNTPYEQNARTFLGLEPTGSVAALEEEQWDEEKEEDDWGGCCEDPYDDEDNEREWCD